MPVFFLGIDDTDAGESIGTGALARELLIWLARQFSLTSFGITRHQLLVHPDIPYTSHNSSACLKLRAETSVQELAAASERFIGFLHHEGADPGLCLFTERELPNELYLFGQRATSEVLRKQEALELAQRHDILLKELGGTGLGIIGALAACTLRMTDNDGRFLSVPGAAALPEEVTVGEILDRTPIRLVIDEEGRALERTTVIATNRWIRPDLVQGQAILRAAQKDGRYLLRKRHDAE